VTCHHIAEEGIFQPLSHENFKTRKYVLDREREEKEHSVDLGVKVRMAWKLTLQEQNLRPWGRFM
jgi:hypothetical protein